MQKYRPFEAENQPGDMRIYCTDEEENERQRLGAMYAKPEKENKNNFGRWIFRACYMTEKTIK